VMGVHLHLDAIRRFPLPTDFRFGHISAAIPS
jgi:hypothetical protein